MLAAAAVCPHPPLLVPELAAGAAGELATLRAACDRAVHGMLDAEPDLVVVVGDAPVTREFPPGARGSFAGYGVDLVVGGRRCRGAGGRPGDEPAPELPLAHTVGLWLLERAGCTGEVLHVGVSAATSSEECLIIGEGLVRRAPRVALLVMGDGSAKRGPHAPGYLDERALAFDDTVARALGSGRPELLARLDPAQAEDLWVVGRAPWQVLAGAVGEGEVSADLLAYTAPYGVAYFVTAWRVG